MQDNVYRPGNSGLKESFSNSQPQSGYGKFDMGGSFQIAIEKFKVNWALAIGVTLVGLLLQLVAYLSIYVLIGFWLAPIVFAGFHMLGIELARGKLTMSTLFRGFEIKGPAWTSTVLMSLIYIIPMIPGIIIIAGGVAYSAFTGSLDQPEPPVALIVAYVIFIISIFIAMPVIMYFRARLILVYPLVFDRGFGGVDAIKESWKVTHEQRWMLMLHIFICGMVAQAGAAMCYVGLIASIPFGAAVMGAAQAQLLGEMPSNPSKSGVIPPLTTNVDKAPEQNPYDDKFDSSGGFVN